MPLVHVAKIVGISVQSLATYRSKHPEFDALVERAVARGVDQRLKVIERAGRNDWRASAWWLERVQAKHFSSKAEVRTEVTGPSGQPIKIETPNKQPIDFRELQRVAREIFGARDEPKRP